MEQSLIMCRSLTYAQRAMKALERGGVAVSLIKAPQAVSSAGCAYGLRISSRNLKYSIDLLRRGNLPFGKVYRYLANGKLEEVSV